jgi:hypothetical protein
MDMTGDDVKCAHAFVLKHLNDKLRDVVDVDVVPPFLALSEQDDVFALLGQAAKPVGAVPVVRIRWTVDQGRP